MRVGIITVHDQLVVIQRYDRSQTHGKTFRVIAGNHLLVHIQEQFSLPILTGSTSVHKVPMFMVLVCLWVLAKPAQRSFRRCPSSSCSRPQASRLWSTRKYQYRRTFLEWRDLKL